MIIKQAGLKKMILNKIRGLWATFTMIVGMPIIIAFIYIFRPINRTIRKSSRAFFWLNFCKVEQIGEFASDAQILVLNHQGVMDICFLEAYYPRDICWIAKKELGDIPIYGHALKAPRMILLDREDKKSLLYLLKIAKNKLDEGRILSIFPEGTRSSGEREFLPFKSGAKTLIEKYDLIIQPIVLINTKKLFNSSKLEASVRTARAVCMQSYKPDFSNPNWYEDLRKNMHRVYLEHYNELNGRNEV